MPSGLISCTRFCEILKVRPIQRLFQKFERMTPLTNHTPILTSRFHWLVYLRNGAGVALGIFCID
jgi:hypothetical protein